MCNTQNKVALMESLPFDSALHRLACLGTQLCAASDGQLFVSMTSGFMCLWEREGAWKTTFTVLLWEAEVFLTSAGVSAHLSVPLQPHGPHSTPR